MIKEPKPQPAKEKPVQPKPERVGRSGQGASSVLPHLKADQRARAVARIAKRRDQDL
jgi:hypothetical protein